MIARGPLKPALLASACLPGVFPVIEHDGRRLVDGGVVNSVPLWHAISGPVDRVYVLNVSGTVTDRAQRSPLDVVMTSFVARPQSALRARAPAPATGRRADRAPAAARHARHLRLLGRRGAHRRGVPAHARRARRARAASRRRRRARRAPPPLPPPPPRRGLTRTTTSPHRARLGYVGASRTRTGARNGSLVLRVCRMRNRRSTKGGFAVPPVNRAVGYRAPTSSRVASRAKCEGEAGEDAEHDDRGGRRRRGRRAVGKSIASGPPSDRRRSRPRLAAAVHRDDDAQVDERADDRRRACAISASGY